MESVVESIVGYGEPVSATELESESTYEGYDFADVWTMNGESTYPYAELQNAVQPPIEVVSTYDLSDFGNDSVIYVGTVETGSEVTLTNNTGNTYENVQIICLEGITLTLNNVNIYNTNSNYCALSFSGSDNHLILEGNSSLRSGSNTPGIKVEEGASLEISGIGELEVSGNSGIGARDGLSAGEITIISGTITATGRWNGAGIGGGENGTGGTIAIYSGTIVASGGVNGGAGIGGGYAGESGEIIIRGGEIKASGGYDAAGIGGGYARGGEIITISGGIINAIGSMDAAGIGGGKGGAAGIITISGGIVYAQQGADDAMYDIGYGYNRPGGSLSISGDAIVFLKEGDCITPDTMTHEFFTDKTVTDNEAFGLDIPDSWEKPVYAYLNSDNVFDLEYNVNGGSGITPPTITQYKDTTAIIASGSNLVKDSLGFVEWNTQADGLGITNIENDEFVITNDLTLYAIYEDPILVTGVSISNINLNMIVGDSKTLSTIISPYNATNKNVGWSSSDNGVVIVDEDGSVSAVSTGTATITVFTEDGGFADTCVVTVTQPVTGVSLDNEIIDLSEDDTDALTATIVPADATNKNVTWVSDNEGVVLVDANGNISAAGTGTATITVTTQDGGFTDMCTVTVKSMDIESSVYSVGSDGTLNGIKIDTTTTQLIANINNDSSDIKIFNENGNEVTSGVLCTGMTVKLIIGGTVRDELTIIILGDANGDGSISITDYTLARLDILGLKALGQTATAAADINGDGVVSITDYTLMRLDILGLKKIH